MMKLGGIEGNYGVGKFIFILSGNMGFMFWFCSVIFCSLVMVSFVIGVVNV